MSFLGLVTDEVYFWFGWSSRSWSWDADLWCVFGSLDQNVDESFLGVLLDLRDNWDGWGWWGWGFDEDDFVVFLWWWWWSVVLSWLDGFWFWGWNMNVDVFLDDWGLGSVSTGGVATGRVTAAAAAAARE